MKLAEVVVGDGGGCCRIDTRKGGGGGWLARGRGGELTRQWGWRGAVR